MSMESLVNKLCMFRFIEMLMRSRKSADPNASYSYYVESHGSREYQYTVFSC